MADGKSLIIKKYKKHCSVSVQMESWALDFYHEIAKDFGEIIDCRTVKLNPDKDMLCMSLMEGENFADILFRSQKDEKSAQRALKTMTALGNFLRRLYNKTCTSKLETSVAVYENMDYFSRQLESIPLIGPLFFHECGACAKDISETFRRSNLPPSFAHGNLVCENILVDGDRLGLVNFSAANFKSHILDDVYNMRFSLANMTLPRSFKKALLDAFYREIDTLRFPSAAHRFYYEYHRRRWLLQKIKNHNPLSWVQATTGLIGYAEPFRQEICFER
jgi:tRNA A-37 threonylcarbamoyl transferase component Bud32